VAVRRWRTAPAGFASRPSVAPLRALVARPCALRLPKQPFGLRSASLFVCRSGAGAPLPAPLALRSHARGCFVSFCERLFLAPLANPPLRGTSQPSAVLFLRRTLPGARGIATASPSRWVRVFFVCQGRKNRANRKKTRSARFLPS
jgi:hypothetical protein